MSQMTIYQKPIMNDKIPIYMILKIYKNSLYILRPFQKYFIKNMINIFQYK